MADPTLKVRKGVMERDGLACASCAAVDGLTFQHRRAVGMGGSKLRPGYADGLAACGTCNARYEGDLQSLALLNGWKVRRWVEDPARVPYYHAATNHWYVLSPDEPLRRAITRSAARRMMNAVYAERMPDGRPW